MRSKRLRLSRRWLRRLHLLRPRHHQVPGEPDTLEEPRLQVDEVHLSGEEPAPEGPREGVVRVVVALTEQERPEPRDVHRWRHVD